MLDKRVYIDTSVLIKSIVEEAYSSNVDTFFASGLHHLVLSDLVVLELACVLRRIQRNKKIMPEYRLKAEAAIAEQISAGWFEKLPVSTWHYALAKQLLDNVSNVSLRSLDALHLMVARDSKIRQIATSDMDMKSAAQQLGLTVHYFNK